MTTPDLLSLVALVIAALSFLYGLLNDVRQRKDRKTVAKLNELLLEREKQESEAQGKASLSAFLFRERENDFYITYENRSKADATDVTVDYPPDFNWQVVSDIFPLEKFEAGRKLRVKVVILFGAVRKPKIVLKWKNPNGTAGTNECLLML